MLYWQFHAEAFIIKYNSTTVHHEYLNIKISSFLQTEQFVCLMPQCLYTSCAKMNINRMAPPPWTLIYSVRYLLLPLLFVQSMKKQVYLSTMCFSSFRKRETFYQNSFQFSVEATFKTFFTLCKTLFMGIQSLTT